MKVYLNEALFGKRFVCFSILVIRIKDFSVIHLIFSLKEEVEIFLFVSEGIYGVFEAGGSEDGHSSHVKSFRRSFAYTSIFVQSGTCHGGNLKKGKVCPEKRKNNDGNLRKCSKRGD